MSQFKVGDIVVYDPPDLASHDYARNYLNAVGVVTDELVGDPPKPPERGETHVNWISAGAKIKPTNPCRHYTKNLRLLGHITGAPEGDVPV